MKRRAEIDDLLQEDHTPSDAFREQANIRDETGQTGPPAIFRP